MSFEIPEGLFEVAATTQNTKAIRTALERQSSEIKRLLEQGKDIPCPYCAQLIAKGAFVCSQCQGVLSIGSWDAISAAIQLEPKLAFRDPETIELLTSKVKALDEHWAEEARKAKQREEEIRLKHQAEIAQQRIARDKQREAERKAQAELAAQKEAERQEYLNSLHPFNRWWRVNWERNRFILLAVVVLVPLLFWIGSGIKSQQDRTKAQQMAAKALCRKTVPVVQSGLLRLRAIKHNYNQALPIDKDGFRTYALNKTFYKSKDLKIKQILSSLDATNRKILRTFKRGTSTPTIQIANAYIKVTNDTKNALWVPVVYKKEKKEAKQGYVTHTMSCTPNWSADWTDIATGNASRSTCRDIPEREFFTFGNILDRSTEPFFTSQDPSNDWNSKVTSEHVSLKYRDRITYLGLESSWKTWISACSTVKK